MKKQLSVNIFYWSNKRGEIDVIMETNTWARISWDKIRSVLYPFLSAEEKCVIKDMFNFLKQKRNEK